MKVQQQVLKLITILLTYAFNTVYVYTKMAGYGFDRQRIQGGLTLCEGATRQQHAEFSARGRKRAASRRHQECLQLAQQHFDHDAGIVRLVLAKLTEPLFFIDAEKVHKQRYDLWLARAKDFYFRLSTTPELLALVQPYGLTLERIELGLQRIEELEAAHAEQKDAIDALAALRQQRDESYLAVKAWVAEFHGFVRVAFANEPEQLVMLGAKGVGRNRRQKAEKPLPEPSQPAEPPLTGRPVGETV